MADDGEKALKLAKQLERRIAALEKKVADDAKASAAWEKAQTDWVKEIDKKLSKAVTDLGKGAVDDYNTLDKKIVDLNNQQAKEMNQIVDWVQKTFSKKGVLG